MSQHHSSYFIIKLMGASTMSTNLLLFILLLFFEKIVTYEQISSCNISDISRDGSPLYFCEIPIYNEIGICQPLHWCNDYRERTDRYKILEVCKYTESGQVAEICCSERRPIAVGSRSQISCSNYFSNINFRAPSPHGYAVPENNNNDLEAAKAKPLEFPHMAAVGFGGKPGIKWVCGGTIVHPQYILTAGHCTATQDGEPSWVRVGDLDLELPNEVNGTRDIRIAKIYRHPQYRYPSNYHDIALLKLETSLNFNNFGSEKPACLHTNEPRKLWENDLQIIGWGATEFGGERSSHLLKVNMSVVNNEECKKRHRKSRRISDGIDSEHQICVGNPFGGDSCQGDSGGPLHYNAKKSFIPHYVLIGITSFGNGCGTVGVYTKVQPYLKWIEDIIWPMCNTDQSLVLVDSNDFS